MALALWTLASLRLGPVLYFLPSRVSEFDFSHYYVSALALRENLNPYVANLTPLATRLGLHVGEINHAGYPPSFLLLFEPLTLLSPQLAYWTWFGLNVLFLAVALFVLFRREAELDPTLTLSLCALAIAYAPTLAHIYFAQPEFLILLLLVFTMRWLKDGHEPEAGLALAAAALFKIFPAMMAGYLVVRHRWQALKWAAIGMTVGGIVTLALVGFERSASFVQILPFLTGRHWLRLAGDVSVQAFVSRLFWHAEAAAGGSYAESLEMARKITIVLAEIAALAMTVRCTLPNGSGEDPDNRAFALWVVVSIMLTPTAWAHYMVLLLIPFSMLAGSAAKGRSDGSAIALAVASYLLITILPVIEAFKMRAVFTAIVSEGATVSLLLAYASAYCFAARKKIGEGLI
jgi:multidrug transporter EmrE-like cation transporter